jgi:hypothetical protein
VTAGSDWRSLNKLAVQDGMLRDFGIMPDVDWHHGVYGVLPWASPSGVIGGRSSPTNGNYSVADPRVPSGSEDFKGMRVVDWEREAGAITTQRSPGSSAQSVADPRIDGHPKSVQLGVRQWDQPAAVVKGDVSVGTGPYAVADPRHDGKPKFNNVFRIVPWNAHAPAVAGPGGPAGGLAVADPRPAERDDYKQTKYRVTRMDEPGGTVIAASTTGNGAFAVADPRPLADLHSGAHGVRNWDEPSGTVQGESLPSNGAFAVADPRPTHGPNAHQNKMAVVDWDDPAKTVTGSDRVGSGALSVADPRTGFGPSTHHNILQVHGWDDASKTITSGTHPSGGALSVADPRPVGLNASREHYKTGGHYGVVPWDQPSNAVPGFAKNNNGHWSVADPRQPEGEPLFELPKPNDRLVAVIRALDDTWHRPFTTLELAALQSLVDPDEVGSFVLDGQSDSAWRERIGNAVPPDAAAAIAGVMGTTLLLAMTGETFMLSSQPIWVRDVAVALSIDSRGNVPQEAAE